MASEWLAWAHTFDSYELVAGSPENLEAVLEPAMRARNTSGAVPEWAGPHLLQAWLFYIYRRDRFAGGYLFDSDDAGTREWHAVADALDRRAVALERDELRVPSRLRHRFAPTRPAATAARGHRDPAVLATKQARWEEPHVAPVQQLVREIREQYPGAFVPYVDPDSGGFHSEVLFVLEAPAAAAARGSGMLSPDNDDFTAATMWNCYQETGLDRTHCLHWNAVPWYLGDGSRIAAAKGPDIDDGQKWLARLVELLPDLRLIVALGGKPTAAVGRYLLHPDAPAVRWLSGPHPSARGLGTGGFRRERIVRAFAIGHSTVGHKR